MWVLRIEPGSSASVTLVLNWGALSPAPQIMLKSMGFKEK